MGIKLKSADEEFDRVVVTGSWPASGTTDVDTIIAPFSGSIKAINAAIGVAGVTGTGVLNLKKNQANLFANATPFSWATGSTATIYDATDFAAGTVISVTKGDRISLDVATTQTTPAKGGVVYILFTRRPNVAISTATMDPTDTRP